MSAPRIIGIVACLSFAVIVLEPSQSLAQPGEGKTREPPPTFLTPPVRSSPEPARAALAAAPKTLDRAALEKQFEETLSGATLIGTFTVTGQNNDDGKKLNEEKYTINEVKKIKDDLWQFKARIQYGGHDLTVPLALEVKWAGDTPVITLTDMPVPGFGTFTARVLIYRGEYAGTWSGGDHGGQLFGRIVKKGEPLDKPDEKTGEKAGGGGAADAKPKS